MTLASRYCCLEGCSGAAIGTGVLCAKHKKISSGSGCFYQLTAEEQLRVYERTTLQEREAARAARKGRP